jgi:hypothetical protein
MARCSDSCITSGIEYALPKMKANDLNRLTAEELECLSMFLDDNFPLFVDHLSDFGKADAFAEALIDKLSASCFNREE